MNKEEYKLKNQQFMEEISRMEGVHALPSGIFYKSLRKGNVNTPTPRHNSVVTVHYRGTLISGKVFDNSHKQRYAPAFQLNQVIKGWQIALSQMHIGEKGIIYIPHQLGYGARVCGAIPAFSTLIFEVELLGIN